MKYRFVIRSNIFLTKLMENIILLDDKMNGAWICIERKKTFNGLEVNALRGLFFWRKKKHI